MMFGIQTGTDSRLPFSPEGSPTAKKVINALKKSKVMKQVIQLQAPFGQTQAMLDQAEFRALSRLAAAARKAMPAITLTVQALACVSLGFTIMFLAAIIGG